MTRVYNFKWKKFIIEITLGLSLLVFLLYMYKDPFIAVIFLGPLIGSWFSIRKVTLSMDILEVNYAIPFRKPFSINLDEIDSYKEEMSAFSNRPAKGTIISTQGKKAVIRSYHIQNFRELSDSLSRISQAAGPN